MIGLADYAARYKASMEKLRYTLYSRLRSKYPWLPTRNISGCIIDAASISRSSRRSKDSTVHLGDG